MANEISISFVCHAFPQKFVTHLKKIRKYSIEKQEDGVYYVKGDFFPIQIIHTRELSSEENLWLKNLTNTLKSKNDILTLMSEYQNHTSNNLYSSVMDIIVKANERKFEEVTDMCDALKEIYLRQNREAYEKEKQEAIDAALAEQQATMAEQQATLAEQQALIVELRAQLAAKENA